MNASLSLLVVVLVALTQLQLSSSFAVTRTRAFLKPVSAFNFDSFIVAAVEVAEKADDYQYGAVAAPSWALPLGAVLVIFTAAIPVLLKPGEEAIAEQRRNEEIMGSSFNKRKDKDLR